MNNLMWLEHWFHGLCDGTWEQTHSLTINTLPTPGWHVSIDLNGTPFDQTRHALLKEMRVSDRDWMTCRLIDGIFDAKGGPLMLGPILQVFRNWIDGYTAP